MIGSSVILIHDVGSYPPVIDNFDDQVNIRTEGFEFIVYRSHYGFEEERG